MEVRERIAEALAAARRGTVELLAGIDDSRLAAQHDPIMSPLLWDYGHIGVYEELWLVDAVEGRRVPEGPRYHVYDAFENPRRLRVELPLMSRDEVDTYRDGVRRRALDLLSEVDVGEGAADRLARSGYVYAMVAQHEWQHQETMLQTLQLLRGGWRPALPAPPPAADGADAGLVTVPAGTYPVGSRGHGPYDNEHPVHDVPLAAFRIDRHPVTCGRYRAFVEDGGYARPELWSEPGRAWLAESRATAPAHWRRDGEGWTTDRFGHAVAVRDDAPVVHVCAHEADAYARWEGRRLPSEEEWEVAATWDPAAGAARVHPWGDGPPDAERANLGRRLLEPAPIGSFPAGTSPLGCAQMVGDVWEWTSSRFHPYPGFDAFPYPEYSRVFFGDEYRVLRGGSFATHPSVARAAFRNWDHPVRRQIFAGFRCADDGEPA